MGGEKLPLPRFYVSRCRGARPGELTCIFFLGTHKYVLSMGRRSLTQTPFWVDEASDFYFKETTVIITGSLKETRLSPNCAFRLSCAGHEIDGLEALLVFGAPETVAIKLGGGTGPFRRGVRP